MSISKARTVAFDVLLRVAKQDAYADEVLRAERNADVKPEDAGLATELALGVLRWQRLLDFAIDRCLKTPASVADVEVRLALRLGAYQLLFLDRIPARAAVNESVDLVKRARKHSAASLVNAVLRKLAKQPAGKSAPAQTIAELLPANLPVAERWGISYSHPTWMVERWFQTLGDERTLALLQADNRAPVLSGWVAGPQPADEVTASLRKAGSRILPGRLLRTAVVLEGGNPGASEAVRQGWLAIQDEASQAVARLVGAEPGNSVLDLCAAPGGKTLLLSRAVGAQGRVIAADLHEHRVRAMQERFNLARVQNVETVVLDATQPLPVGRDFDRILADVPCSGTGTLARHPEIRWKLQPADLADLQTRQMRLLRNALPYLAPGGRLVYSTCSLEPEENEAVVRGVLDETGGAFQLADPRDALGEALQDSVPTDSLVAADGFFRTFPPLHGTDGFFAAAITRQKPSA